MSAKPTPTPWKFDTETWEIQNNNGHVIADLINSDFMERANEANAAHIVRCVNAMPAMVEALEAAFDYPADVFDLPDNEPFTMTVTGRHLRMVRAALALAKGE